MTRGENSSSIQIRKLIMFNRENKWVNKVLALL